MPVPKPHDPRTPLQAAQDKLAATRRKLVHEHPPIKERLRLADRERTLQAEILELETSRPLIELVVDGRSLGASTGKAAALIKHIVLTGRKNGVVLNVKSRMPYCRTQSPNSDGVR